MVYAVYKNRSTTYFKGTKTTREAAEKLFMNVKKKKEPVFIKEVHINEDFPVKDVNEDVKKESEWEPWDEEPKIVEKAAEKVVNELIDTKGKEAKNSDDSYDKEMILNFLKKSQKDLKINSDNSKLPIKIDDIITNKMIWDASIELMKQINLESFLYKDNILLQVLERLFESKNYIESFENQNHNTKIPAVDPSRSIHPDYIICLEDGHKCKMLKSYLRRFKLTPEQYIKKWNLPHDYPMAAPNLSKIRKKIAEKHKIWQTNPHWKKGNR